jgi:rhodanese-related sulfurtransferase
MAALSDAFVVVTRSSKHSLKLLAVATISSIPRAPPGTLHRRMAETETSEQGTAVDPRTAAELVSGGADVVDVRGDEEYEAGHVEDAKHIPLEELGEDSPGLAGERPVVFYCRSGQRSALAAGAFRASGWEAYHVDGGLVGWVEAGLPLEPEDGEVAERSNLPGA